MIHKSIFDAVTEVISKTYYDIMEKEISKIESEMISKIQKIANEQRSEAKKTANTMTLEMLQKADISGISIEFKL